MPTPMNDGELVNNVMALRGWSQRDLADVLELSQGQVSLLATGKAKLRMSERMELNRLIARHHGVEDFAAGRFECSVWDRLRRANAENDVDAVMDHVEMCPRCISRIVRAARGSSLLAAG